MPNHVTTVIHCNNPQALQDLLEDLTPEDIKEREEKEARRARSLDELFPGDSPHQPAVVYTKTVTFEKLIPSPENKEVGGCSGEHPEGVICWHSWNTKNWGTKWDGYGLEIVSENEIRFDTAWSHPQPVIEALSRRHPQETFKVLYADEDLGCNLGAYLIRDGEIENLNTLVDGSEAAVQFAHILKYGCMYEEELDEL